MIAMIVKLLVLVLLALGLGLMAYIRLAPSDPALWHQPLATGEPARPGPCADQVILVPQGARASCLLPLAPAQVLERLEATALTSARTQHLAGSPAEGRITWVARSFLMGFPDYITAETRPTPEGTRLDIFSRQRFGRKDFGVNAARLKDWLSQL